RDHALPAFAGGKLRTSGIGQRLFGGIEHLDEMSAHALRRDLLEPCARLGHGLEKIAEQKTFGEAAEPRAGRKALLAALAHEDLGDAARGVASPIGAPADQADALAAAGEQLG